MNPGGPGVSGVQVVVSGGEMLAATIGPQFDLISFDPRGEFAPLLLHVKCSKRY